MMRTARRFTQSDDVVNVGLESRISPANGSMLDSPYGDNARGAISQFLQDVSRALEAISHVPCP